MGDGTETRRREVQGKEAPGASEGGTHVAQ